jgi:hypothetical protein
LANATDIHSTAGVSGNVVMGNVIHGNGLSGVTIHAHEPVQNLNGNEIVGNKIGRNNLLGDPIGWPRR